MHVEHLANNQYILAITVVDNIVLFFLAKPTMLDKLGILLPYLVTLPPPPLNVIGQDPLLLSQSCCLVLQALLWLL